MGWLSEWGGGEGQRGEQRRGEEENGGWEEGKGRNRIFFCECCVSQSHTEWSAADASVLQTSNESALFARRCGCVFAKPVTVLGMSNAH